MAIKVLKYIKNPLNLVGLLGARGFLNWVPDKLYLKVIFRAKTGKKLNLDNPRSYNEKLQWFKVYDRKEEYCKYVDKYEVRSYVSRKLGQDYLIPVIGVYDSVEEIDWNALPNQFVLKCTHGSGTNIICNNKEELDINASKKMLNRWMKKNWYWYGREWPYKNVRPRIICEKYMVDESGTELKDYKIFCFNGEPKLIQVDFGRFTEHKRHLYSTDWEFIDAEINHIPNNPSIIPKPRSLDEMLRCAGIISKYIPQVRVDFYSINNQIYFGEMTFSHHSGFAKFEPESLEMQMGEWIKLPN
ncbi:glycosyl transferase [Virgibacillus sp. NKC19-16]|nr:glycosyl transferase [Virgibacillus sp. NKC19-16]